MAKISTLTSGGNLKDVDYSKMPELIENEVAYQYSRTGSKMNKKSLQDLKRLWQVMNGEPN